MRAWLGRMVTKKGKSVLSCNAQLLMTSETVYSRSIGVLENAPRGAWGCLDCLIPYFGLDLFLLVSLLHVSCYLWAKEGAVWDKRAALCSRCTIDVYTGFVRIISTTIFFPRIDLLLVKSSV